ncbi:MAG: ParA family protein [Bdellovibrionales bacterium]|nr:ParA family protein [Bdellovibrionales bacterium]
MGVICFASLKGGVGKTTLSLNIAGALAARGCETLLIDLDPAGHSSRFFQRSVSPFQRSGSRSGTTDVSNIQSPLAKLFLSGRLDVDNDELGTVIETALELCLPMIAPVRPRMALLPAGPELRHFLWGKAARTFRSFFPRLLEELRCSYDYVVIDTPPDYNVLSRNAIAASDLVVVPLDASAMSIDCLEELVKSCAHIKGPTWSILRTMVNRQASRVRELAAERLHSNLNVAHGMPHPAEDEADADDDIEANLEDADRFIEMMERRETRQSNPNGFSAAATGSTEDAESPIYLLNSVVYRTEQQNRLSFLGKTAFDTRATFRLAEQYGGVARELEEILSLLSEEADNSLSVADLMTAAHHPSAG